MIESTNDHSPLVIGVAGGSASGKTSVCQAILDRVGIPGVALVHMDSFYKVLTEEEKKRANASNFNFDHPDAFDLDVFHDTIVALRKGEEVNLPIYDFKTHSRVVGKTENVKSSSVVIVEGIYVLFDERIRNLLDVKLFVDTEDDIRLARRLQRDIIERNRDCESVLHQYERFVKPAFDDYIYPTKRFADVIIPRGVDNTVAIDLLAVHIREKLLARGIQL